MIDLRRRQVRPLVIAHRGFSALYPDNTLEAFSAAIDAGADIIEMDIRRDADGRLICAHDVGADGPLVELALKAVGGRVPILFDIKEADVIPDLCRLARGVSCVMGLRDISWLKILRRESDEIAALAMLRDPDPADFADFYAQGGDIARLWEGNVTAQHISIARGKDDYPVWVTTQKGVDFGTPGHATAQSLTQLASLGVDGVLVNDVALAVRTLQPSTKSSRFGGR